MFRAQGIVIELIAPNEDFWGVDLQVNKTLVELQNPEKSLRGEQIDLQLVQEYRYAIDYLCNTTDTLRRRRTYEPHPSDDQELLSLFGADRIRRATTMSAWCETRRPSPYLLDTRSRCHLFITLRRCFAFLG